MTRASPLHVLRGGLGGSSLENWRNDRIGSAERGVNPLVIAQMPSGFVVIGDTQFLPGYCVLLASPKVGQLSELPLGARGRFLLDMSLLGEAIERACQPDGLHRVNYEILGNTDAYLHAHVFPRYRWEPSEWADGPVWLYPHDRWTDARYCYDDEVHGPLRLRMGDALRLVVRQARGVDLADTP
jgi:diadenosine tetraphosphate (Ap4A) HIT family hydrolase